MPRNFTYLDNFAEGETGLHADYLYGWKLFRGILIYNGTFHGYNVMRYIDGSLGPRPGLRPLTITGLPTGVVWGFGKSAWPNKTGIVVINNAGTAQVYGIPLEGGGAATLLGSLASVPTVPVAMIPDGNQFVYLTSQGDKTYQIDLNANTTTAIANSPGGSLITIYNSRLVIGNMGGANINEIIFSDPYAPGVASPNQFTFQASPTFVLVGDALQVTALLAQRTHLSIAKQTGWFVYQGEPNLNASLRQITHSAGPFFPQEAMLLRNDLIYYVPLFTDMPAIFNGSTYQEPRQLRFANSVYTNTGQPPAFGVCDSNQAPDVLVYAGKANTNGANMGWYLHNGAGSYHTFYVDLSGYCTHNNGNMNFCDGGGVGVTAKFYAWPSDLDRPVKVGDTYGAITDGVVAASGSVANPNYVEFPEWESRDGSEITVRAVHVSFRKWNTGTTQSNHMECAVVSTRQYNKPGAPSGSVPAYGQSSGFQAWDESPTVAVADGQLSHHVFKFGNQTSGNGFKLILQNLRGVSIQKLQVILDIAETRS